MPESFPLPPPCLLRPATAGDKWQIQSLLKNFDQEIARPDRSTQVAYWVGLGVSGAIVFSILAQLSLQILIYSLLSALLACLVRWLSIALSQDWKKYWVIETQGQLVACAKLCNYAHCSILFNLLVAPYWRKQGLGSALVRQLSSAAVKPLYLACTPAKVEFYARLGFAPASPRSVSPLIRYDLGLTTQPNLVLLKQE